MANDVHKIKLLLLWDILCKNTDEDHALNTDELTVHLSITQMQSNARESRTSKYRSFASITMKSTKKFIGRTANVIP